MPRALIKGISPNFASGLTSQTEGSPDQALACSQHAAYQAALEQMGCEILLLPADDLPDSCFVEDMAIVAEGLVIATLSPVRQAEQPPVLEALRQALPDYRHLTVEAPGRLEGGDVLQINRHCLVGLTARTNQAGIDQLRAFLEPQGHKVTAVEAPGLLHLKTGATRLDHHTVLTLPHLAQTFRTLGYKVVLVDPDDAHAANVVALGRKVLLPAGYPRVVQALVEQGFTTHQVDLSEFKKQDGGATCLSILLP